MNLIRYIFILIDGFGANADRKRKRGWAAILSASPAKALLPDSREPVSCIVKKSKCLPTMPCCQEGIWRLEFLLSEETPPAGGGVACFTGLYLVVLLGIAVIVYRRHMENEVLLQVKGLVLYYGRTGFKKI